MQVAIINKKGIHRVLNGEIGMTFVIDDFTPDRDYHSIAHVRDYRYSCLQREFQIWTIPYDGYELVEL